MANNKITRNELMKKLTNDKLSINIYNINPEDESTEYYANKLSTNLGNILFRIAKITPKKIGLFVTLWKRVNKITVPYKYDDNFEYVIIYCEDGLNTGFFMFNKETLIKNNIISSSQTTGKNGFRVYPPWSSPNSKQAIKTKEWQCKNFIYTEIPNEN